MHRSYGWALALGLVWLCVAASPRHTWGQEAQGVGTVLAVEGSVEARAPGETRWEPLRFRDEILLHDTVRTGQNSKLKVLLRDDSIITLAEHSEMEFSDFLLDQEQRRNVMSLVTGTLKVLTTRIFGKDSVTEVHTPNAVAGVRGTIFIVTFIPPDTTDIFSLLDVVTARNLDPAIPEIEPVSANMTASVLGTAGPTQATQMSQDQMQQLQNLQVTEQAPGARTPALTEEARAGTDAPSTGGADGDTLNNPHTQDTITPDLIFRDTPIVIPIPRP